MDSLRTATGLNDDMETRYGVVRVGVMPISRHHFMSFEDFGNFVFGTLVYCLHLHTDVEFFLEDEWRVFYFP